LILKLRPLALLVGLLCIPAVSAHHRWPVNMSLLVTVQGTVTEFEWVSPHPMIGLEVLGEDGATEEWRVGGPALNRMEAKGWNRDTLKPGDVITGIGYQFLDGSKIIRLERVLMADGRELLVYANQ
jgi:hypothetical protein